MQLESMPQDGRRKYWQTPTLTKECVEAHAWGPIPCGPESDPVWYSSEDSGPGGCC